MKVKVPLDSRRHIHSRSIISALAISIATDCCTKGRLSYTLSWLLNLPSGSMKQRTQTLALLDFLPHARVAQPREVRTMIEARHLYNFGFGLTDAHLIASTLLDAPILQWTEDHRLRRGPNS